MFKNIKHIFTQFKFLLSIIIIYIHTIRYVPVLIISIKVCNTQEITILSVGAYIVSQINVDTLT